MCDSSDNHYNIVSNNTIHNCTYYGIFFWMSSNNIIVDNWVADNARGFYLGRTGPNSIVENSHIMRNTIIRNIEYGIKMQNSHNNWIYHNNIIENPIQAEDSGLNNQWHSGHPSGGNYWSDWTSPDIMAGPNQDIPGSDGFVDNPRAISGGSNQDNYPFTTPNGWVIEPIPAIGFDWLLVNGSNFISCPMDPMNKGSNNIFDSYDALNLCHAVTGDDNMVIQRMSNLNTVDQEFHYGDSEASAFAMDSVHGYRINITVLGQFVVHVNAENYTGPGANDVMLNPGWNLLGFTHDYVPWTWIPRAIDFTDGTVDSELDISGPLTKIVATKWEWDVQLYQSYVVMDGFPGIETKNWYWDFSYSAYPGNAFWLWVETFINITFDQEIGMPVMVLNKTAPAIAFNGDSITYQINYTNIGTDTACNVWINDTLPAGVNYIGSSLAPNFIVGQKIGWYLGDIPVGAFNSIQITVQINLDVVGIITNTAYLDYTNAAGIPQPPESASASTMIAFQLRLEQGWNLFSMPLIPPDPSLDAVFGDQLTGGLSQAESDKVFKWDPVGGKWKVAYLYEDGNPANTGWIFVGGETFTLEPDFGYWVWIRDDLNHTGVTFNMFGEIPGERHVPISVGWNLVGWTSTSVLTLQNGAMDASGLFASGFTGGASQGTSDRVFSWDGAGWQVQYMWQDGGASDGTWIGTTFDLAPGKAYWVEVRGGHDGFVWTYGTSSTNIIDENFDSYAAGNFPSLGGWIVTYNGAGDSYQTVIDSLSVSPSNSLQLLGSGGWSCVVRKDFSWSSDVIGYEYSIRTDNLTWTDEGLTHSGFNNPSAATWGKYYACPVFCNNGTVYASGQFLQNFDANTWYKVRVELNTVTNLYDIWINNELRGDDLLTLDSDTELINAICLSSGWPGVKIYYDNVKVFEGY
jgi:uncharacterized repeat protein (TIGR01451 family)